MRDLVVVTSLAVLGFTPAVSGVEPRTKVVVAGPEYAKGGLHRWLFGADYRALWARPIEIEVLDMQSFAGGLTAAFRVGGQQTKGLALEGRDGRDYTFRGLDKDLSEILPENLLGTFAQRLIKDQGAGQHPAGALVADPLMEAAGVLHAETRLVVLPDDPALGEFGKDFAGVPGTLAEYPGTVSATKLGFQGATEILKHKEMYARLEASPDDRVDSRALLKARLVDLLIGDWDRHRDQWRWAKRPGQPLWQPIAEDRDQAFSRYEGLILAVLRNRQPRLRNYGPSYGSINGLTWNGWEQDRWLLTELERAVWREVAAELRGQITDAVIETAARRLPPDYFAIDGPRLLVDLKRRRDGLPEVAERYYRHLADKVDVYLTSRPERVEVERLDDGDVEVRVSVIGSDGQAAEPYYRRRFRRDETHEVRLYLRGGDDHVVTTGRPGGILVRAIGGAGNDVVDDTRGGGTRLYDSQGTNRVAKGPGTKLDTKPYTPPPGPKHAPWIPPRDWGRVWYALPYLGYSPDLGVFGGAGFDTRGFGFRRLPFANRHVLRAGWAFGAQTGRAEYAGEFRRENSRVFTTIDAYASGLEVLRLYGLGNETTSDRPDDFYKVFQQQYSLRPAFSLPLASNLYLSLGPIVKYSTTDRTRNAFVNQAKPYGVENFGEAGLTGTLTLEARRPRKDFPSGSLLPENGYPTGGALVRVAGAVYPAIWSAKSTFGSLEATASTYLTGGERLTVGLRAGGKKVFGDYPFYEAAFLGGGTTLRGFRRDRFAGDASLYGNVELRLYLSRYFLLLPGQWGLLGFGDAGRVYLEGETSDTWHTAWGGGLWFAYLDRKNTITISVARSEERTGIYVRAGFVF